MPAQTAKQVERKKVIEKSLAIPSNVTRYGLRTTPRVDLTEIEVMTMLRRYGFYCTDQFFHEWANPFGKGVAHRYEPLHGGKVIMDHATGLMWQQSGSKQDISFSGAQKYISRLNRGFFGWRKFAGYDDWRLPTLEEAMSLMEAKAMLGMHISSVFDFQQRYIFTADEHYVDGRIWQVFYNMGFCALKSCRSFMKVRAVRTA